MKILEHHVKELKYNILLFRQGELLKDFKKEHGVMRMVLSYMWANLHGV